MNDESPSRQPGSVAQELRARGYRPLPRLWVKEKDLIDIVIFAHRYEKEITEVRRQFGASQED